MNVFVFDIETVPDVVTGGRLLGLTGLSEKEIADAMLSQAKALTGQSFVKHHLHQIVAISAVFRQGESLKVWSLGEIHSSEQEIIQRFFAGIEKYLPTLVSWNGSQFDLPVLHYRALYHGISAPAYWEVGEENTSFKYNNYLNRYHHRHQDLMDILAAYHPKAFARLDEIAMMLGFPGKMGLSGNQVLDFYVEGDLEKIRQYCETDVLNTYLVYLRTQLMRGVLTTANYIKEIQLAKNVLAHSQALHLLEFLKAWNGIDVKIG